MHDRGQGEWGRGIGDWGLPLRIPNFTLIKTFAVPFPPFAASNVRKLGEPRYPLRKPFAVPPPSPLHTHTAHVGEVWARILHNMPLIKVFKVHLSAAWSFRQTESVSTTHTEETSTRAGFKGKQEERSAVKGLPEMGLAIGIALAVAQQVDSMTD